MHLCEMTRVGEPSFSPESASHFRSGGRALRTSAQATALHAVSTPSAD